MTYRKYVVVLSASALAAVGLLAQQSKPAMTKEQMLNMPYAKVKATLSNPATRAKALAMAKKNGVILMGGVPVEGENVTLTVENSGGLFGCDGCKLHLITERLELPY